MHWHSIKSHDPMVKGCVRKVIHAFSNSYVNLVLKGLKYLKSTCLIKEHCGT